MHKLRAMIRHTAPVRRLFIWVLQLGAFVFSAVMAFVLRFDFSLPSAYRVHFVYALLSWFFVKTVVFRVAKLDGGLWRYVSVVDLMRLAIGNVTSSIVSAIVILAFAPSGFPRSIFIIDLMICFLATSAVRVMVRIVAEANSGALVRKTIGKRVLIYGAGDAGTTLLREIRNNPKLAYRVCGFLDDNHSKKGLRVNGLPVLGGADKVKSAVLARAIEIVLIAIPSATGPEMTRLLRACHAAGVECKTVPGLGDMIEGSGLAGQIRSVAVEDLLGRAPVRLQENLIRGAIEGKVILVTGAAGSIGSELCRQIARFRPAAIVGVEIAESPLFEIDREMRQNFPGVPFRAEIGSIQNRARINEIFKRYRPVAVYHAAAYKHVPLMEEQVFEAFENNVFGTYNVAVAAREQNVDDFVLLSTDKAVGPTSVMGATKRLAELMLQSLQNGGTQYVMVRFGNVLGSSGSVIQIFKKQIAAGGPVTVTHPDMRRYFMTIPEACQLVLQAAAIGEGGQICVLDMGQPLKIVDLARNLILLSGLKPDEDIRIEFTGIRPGEKLCEELTSLLEGTISTNHEKVRIYTGNGFPLEDLENSLTSFREICVARNMGRLIMALKETVSDYNPSADVLRRIMKHHETHQAIESRIVSSSRVLPIQLSTEGRFSPPDHLSARLHQPRTTDQA